MKIPMNYVYLIMAPQKLMHNNVLQTISNFRLSLAKNVSNYLEYLGKRAKIPKNLSFGLSILELKSSTEIYEEWRHKMPKTWLVGMINVMKYMIKDMLGILFHKSSITCDKLDNSFSGRRMHLAILAELQLEIRSFTKSSCLY